MTESRRANPYTEGVIHRDALYRRDELLRRLGLGEHGWRSLKSQGMPVVTLAGRCYVSGEAFLQWLRDRTDTD